MSDLDTRGVEAALTAYRDAATYPIVPANHDAAIEATIRAYLPYHRAEVIEECAKVAESFMSADATSMGGGHRRSIARAIRSLASPKSDTEGLAMKGGAE